MSISRLATAVALVLVSAASFAIAPVGAQAAQGDLISTACGGGFLTKCGTEPTVPTCEFSISFNKDAGSLFGISLSFSKCTYHGSRDVFKDFYRGQTAGACVVHPPRVPSDDRRDDEQEALSEC